MAGFGALGADAGADPFEFFAEEALPAAFGLFGDLLADGFGFEVGGVIAGVGIAAAVGELDDAGGDDVEEIAVVGDEDDGAGEIAEELLQPEDGFGVEVVGRLVQEEQVGLGGEGAAEGDAAFLASGQGSDEGVEGRGGEVRGGGVDAGLEFPAVGGLDLVEEDGQLAVGALAGFVASEPIDEVGGARLDVLADGEGALELEFLGQVADAEAAAPGDIAGIGVLVSGEDAEEAGFAAAVAADEADLFAGSDGEGDGLEQTLVAIGQGDVVGGEQGWAGHIHGQSRGEKLPAGQEQPEAEKDQGSAKHALQPGGRAGSAEGPRAALREERVGREDHQVDGDRGAEEEGELERDGAMGLDELGQKRGHEEQGFGVGELDEESLEEEASVGGGEDGGRVGRSGRRSEGGDDDARAEVKEVEGAQEAEGAEGGGRGCQEGAEPQGDADEEHGAAGLDAEDAGEAGAEAMACGLCHRAQHGGPRGEGREGPGRQVE